MTGTNFYYDDHALSDYGLIISGSDEEQSFISRSVVGTEQSVKRPEQHVFNTSYDDVLKIPFSILKNPHDNPNQLDMRFTEQELSEIRRWLESPRTPKELIVENKNNIENETICYFGLFTDVQPFVVGADCYGLDLTFQCNAPYGYSTPIVHVFEFPKTSTYSYQYACLSDEKYDFVYPVIKLYLNSSISNKGTITIKNITDNNNSLTINLPNTSYITIDCKKKQILNADGNNVRLCDLGFSTDDIFDYYSIFTGSVSIYWPRLVYGENEFKYTTSVLNSVTKIEMTYRLIRKVDGF